MATNIKHCPSCDQDKPLANFWTRSVKGTKYPFYICSTCANEKRRGRQVRKERTEKIRERERIYNKSVRLDPDKRAKIICRDCRYSDKKRGLVNDLTVDFVDNLIADGCSYCGNASGVITLDRKNNKEAHNTDNVLAACYRCNLIRGSMPYDAWVEIAPTVKLVYEKGLFGEWRNTPISRKTK